MPQPIVIRQSAVPSHIPTVGQLQLGELGINTYDGLVFLKKSVSGVETIVTIAPANTSPGYASRLFFGG